MSYPIASFPMLKLKIKEMDDASRPSIIFWGTPEFAAIILKELINNQFSPRAVVTSSDKAVGRKQILTPSPVKELALKYDIPVLQPENLQTYKLTNLQIYQPDLFIVAAYGLILPKEIFEIPKHGSLNIHPSLLPKYRGASPIQAVILNGDRETGVTIILMDEKVDHGPILAQREWEIRNPEKGRGPLGTLGPKFEILNRELAELGAKLLIETLPRWLNGEIKPIPQDHSRATFTKIIKKEDGQIDWTKSAEEIERQIRALHRWPGSYTKIKSRNPNLENKILKISEVEVLKENKNKKFGGVFLTNDKQLAVQTGNGTLILEEIQLEGKKPMNAKNFLNGHPEIIGTKLE